MCTLVPENMYGILRHVCQDMYDLLPPTPIHITSVVKTIPLLEWAKQHGCPWTSITCGWIAYSGTLDVLQWARTNKCPWNWYTHYMATELSPVVDTSMVQWISAQGCVSSSTDACRLLVHRYLQGFRSRHVEPIRDNTLSINLIRNIGTSECYTVFKQYYNTHPARSQWVNNQGLGISYSFISHAVDEHRIILSQRIQSCIRKRIDKIIYPYISQVVSTFKERIIRHPQLLPCSGDSQCEPSQCTLYDDLFNAILNVLNQHRVSNWLAYCIQHHILNVIRCIGEWDTPSRLGDLYDNASNMYVEIGDQLALCINVAMYIQFLYNTDLYPYVSFSSFMNMTFIDDIRVDVLIDMVDEYDLLYRERQQLHSLTRILRFSESYTVFANHQLSYIDRIISKDIYIL